MSTGKELDKKTSRRGFLGVAASAGAAVAAPFQVTTAGRTGAAAGAMGVTIPSSLAMSSGAPLGGIGTGFIELRPDGGFYEWQIFNSGAWAGRAGTAAPGGARPQFLKFLLRTAQTGGAN